MALAPEPVIAGLAGRQHGVVTRPQLLRAGVSANAIDHRVKARWLRPIHRGVYVIDPMAGAHTRAMAAVLAAGPGAVLSHRSAAVEWRLIPDLGGAVTVEVTVPHGRDGGRHRPRIRAHRVSSLASDEVAKLNGMAITSASRTLLDIASIVRYREVEQAVARAESQGLTSHAKLMALLARHPRWPGRGALRAILGEESGPALTRSKAEERFLALVRKARMPEPEVNVKTQGYEVDFYWRENRLVVEIDGRAYHSSARSFQRDRDRDGVLVAAGLRVMRVTWYQVVNEPEVLLVRLAQALAR